VEFALIWAVDFGNLIFQCVFREISRTICEVVKTKATCVALVFLCHIVQQPLWHILVKTSLFGKELFPVEFTLTISSFCSFATHSKTTQHAQTVGTHETAIESTGNWIKTDPNDDN